MTWAPDPMMEEREPNLFWMVAAITRTMVTMITAMTAHLPIFSLSGTGGATWERLNRVGRGTGAGEEEREASRDKNLQAGRPCGGSGAGEERGRTGGVRTVGFALPAARGADPPVGCHRPAGANVSGRAASASARARARAWSRWASSERACA